MLLSTRRPSGRRGTKGMKADAEAETENENETDTDASERGRLGMAWHA